MKISEEKLIGGAKQTGKVMHRLAREYYFDMAVYGSLPTEQMFRILSQVPFRADPEGHELVQRPKYTMTYGGDCDDKAIAAAAYAIVRGLPYRFVAVGRKRTGQKRIPLTHVYTEFKIGNEWVPFDCTYAYNILGRLAGSFDRAELI